MILYQGMVINDFFNEIFQWNILYNYKLYKIMKSYLKQKLFSILAIILVIIILYVCYRYLSSYENFEELGTLYSSKMNEAVNLPTLKKWTYPVTHSWHRLKVNEYSMKLRDMNFTQ
jgi:hypothetical protein